MEKYYVVNVIKSPYFDVCITEAIKEVYLLGVFDEMNVRDKLREYIHKEGWDPMVLPDSGKTKEILIEEYITEILANPKEFIYTHDVTYTFIVEEVELNRIREESRETCILWYN